MGVSMCGSRLCMAGGYAWWEGGMRGRGVCIVGVCVAGKRQLQQAVCILLKCILVVNRFCCLLNNLIFDASNDFQHIFFYFPFILPAFTLNGKDLLRFDKTQHSLEKLFTRSFELTFVCEIFFFKS